MKQKTLRHGKVRTLRGAVVSLGSAKTAVVAVSYTRQHPLYRKILRRTKRFSCQADIEGIAIGDTVVIRQCRPISKTKHFIITKKVTL